VLLAKVPPLLTNTSRANMPVMFLLLMNWPGLIIREAEKKNRKKSRLALFQR
jgi:hypothetical protein